MLFINFVLLSVQKMLYPLLKFRTFKICEWHFCHHAIRDISLSTTHLTHINTTACMKQLYFKILNAINIQF